MSSGIRSNLDRAVKSKDFHFLNETIVDQQIISRVNGLNFSRIDYAFFVADNGKTEAIYRSGVINFLHILKSVKGKKRKICSSINFR